MGIETPRQKPDWQNSIRTVTPEAFKAIINLSGGLVTVSTDTNIEALKADLKMYIDGFYLEDNHQSLVDIINLSTQLIQTYGVMIN